MALASSGYGFSIGSNGGTGCTTVAQSVTTPPTIAVELTAVSPSGQTSANFTSGEDESGCTQVPGASWGEVTLGAGFQAINGNDSGLPSVKLMGGTGDLQPAISVDGHWQP